MKFLQDKEVKPVGSSASKKGNVRIIALTNQNLEQKIKEGSFREDLYYRFNVLSVKVPPLRQREEDVPMLVREFINQTCIELDMDPMEIDPAALGYLSRQPWQGNVGELLNYVRRLAVFSNGKTIDLSLIQLIEGDEDSLQGMGENSNNPISYKGYRHKAGQFEPVDGSLSAHKSMDSLLFGVSRLMAVAAIKMQKRKPLIIFQKIISKIYLPKQRETYRKPLASADLNGLPFKKSSNVLELTWLTTGHEWKRVAKVTNIILKTIFQTNRQMRDILLFI